MARRAVVRGLSTSARAGRMVTEPYRIKAVEPIAMTTREERVAMLKRAHYNPFLLASDNVLLDLLTDSGTGAMSATQWAALMTGDESYAGSSSYTRFCKAIHSVMPNLTSVFPVHQGRAAERILALLLGGPDRIIPSNTHFDTTRANFEFHPSQWFVGTTALDFPTPEALESHSLFPFKGNMDIQRLVQLLETEGDKVPFVVLTVTNNASGGQPVSMANIRDVAKIAGEFGKPFFLDCCRFAENAYFIKLREEGYMDKSIPDICTEMFSLCNGAWMSSKKDAIVNIGGFLCLDDTLEELGMDVRDQVILGEGYPTYGGLAGRDLEAMAVGLHEGMDEEYLEYRVGSVEYVAAQLLSLNIPMVRPAGGHAVFIDAKRFLEHIPALQYPGHSLACALYTEGGIRSCEIGSLMFGVQRDGSEKPAAMELTRLAFPRRVYTSTHMDYIVEIFAALKAKRSALPGYRITSQPPRLRHFSAHLVPVSPKLANGPRVGLYV